MLGIICFGISLILVLTSSYFIACGLKIRRIADFPIFLSLITISQLIISIELLSIVKQVNPVCLLIINFLFFIFSLPFAKKGLFVWPVQLQNVNSSIIKAVKSDKVLFILLIAFILASLISLFLAMVIPTNSPDTLTYHFARIGFWLQHQTLAHFETSSLRQIVFPVNSEMLILWPMIFLRRDYLATSIEYFAYMGCVLLLFNYLSYFKFSMKRILWAIFILASLPAVILESSSDQTNLIVAFLLFCSLYLFIIGVRENDVKSLIFSSIAYSIALGTKESAFLFIPVFGIIYSLISFREKNKEFYKPLSIFILAAIPSFLLLSSYNYILNYIDFGNVFGPKAFMQPHFAKSGINNFLAGLIKYLLLFFDFSGMIVFTKFMAILNTFFIGLKDVLYHIFNLQNSSSLVMEDWRGINGYIHENRSMFGILGFVLILPLVLKYGLNLLQIKSYKEKFAKDRIFYLSIAGFITVGFLLTISAVMGFSFWYNRFITTAVVLSSPVLVMSYSRKLNPVKIGITLIAVLNFLIISNFNAIKPFFVICSYYLPNFNFNTMRHEIRLRGDNYLSGKFDIYDLLGYLHSTAPNFSSIGLIFSEGDLYYPFFEENPTWKIFPVRYELLEKRKNYNDYDFLVISGESQIVFNLEESVTYNYKLDGNNITFISNTKPLIVYGDRSGKIITSGIPVDQKNVINFSKIPADFKLMNVIRSGKGNTYYIYGKIPAKSFMTYS